jgi:hypothetical protein
MSSSAADDSSPFKEDKFLEFVVDCDIDDDDVDVVNVDEVELCFAFAFCKFFIRIRLFVSTLLPSILNNNKTTFGFKLLKKKTMLPSKAFSVSRLIFALVS